MSSSSYNSEYWHSRVKKYADEEWSLAPSPFAQLAASYFESGSRILELGTGAGQDGIWLAEQGFNVTATDGTDAAFSEIEKRSQGVLKPQLIDITNPLPFEDGSFGVVYAQLVLHYFNDATMERIMAEIQRVLVPGGVLACMVNSVNDPEYNQSLEDKDHLLSVNGLTKRFFTLESFTPFVENFSPLLFNDEGRTPKDDAVSTTGMIQFIGTLGI